MPAEFGKGTKAAAAFIDRLCQGCWDLMGASAEAYALGPHCLDRNNGRR